MKMLLIKMPSGPPTSLDGRWLKEYDPDRDGYTEMEGRLNAHIVVTDDPAQALDLPAAEMYELYKRVDARDPRRPDGKPNRPLTAFTVEFVS